MKDMNGFKNELLTVIEFYGKKGRTPIWRCLCKCGKEILRNVYQINTGKPMSCGCLGQRRHGNKNHHAYHTKHGLSQDTSSPHHRIYGTWKNLKQRCYNEKNQDYSRYGGKGIIVCDQWKNDSSAFISWALANGWKKGLSIDRIDSYGNYSPENCQFITLSENSRKVFIENPAYNRGESHKDATTTEDQVRQIKKMLLSGISQVRIHREMNVSINVVWQIKNNRTWKHVTV